MQKIIKNIASTDADSESNAGVSRAKYRMRTNTKKITEQKFIRTRLSRPVFKDRNIQANVQYSTAVKRLVKK